LNGYEGYDEGCSSHSTAYLNEYAYSSKALAEYISINGPTVSFHQYAFKDIFGKASSTVYFLALKDVWQLHYKTSLFIITIFAYDHAKVIP